MPLVRRKRPLEADKEDVATNRHKRLKSGNKTLYEFDKIGYSQDHYHSLHRSLPLEEEELQKVLAMEIGSFLNGSGGILCFGCRMNGTAYGEWVNRKEEDNIKLCIDNVFKRFRPMVEPQNYRVTFTPLAGCYSRGSQLQILELRIRPGDPYEMYEDYNHEVYLRKNDMPFGPLTPHEIKRLTTQQLWKKLKATASLQRLLEPPKESATLDRSLAGREKRQKNSRAESSGSEEDPIAVAVVRPMVSVRAKPVEGNSGAGEKVPGKSADSATPTTPPTPLNQVKCVAPTIAKTSSSLHSVSSMDIGTKPSSSSSATSNSMPGTSSSSSTSIAAAPSSLTHSTVNTKPVSVTKPLPPSRPPQSTRNLVPYATRKIRIPFKTKEPLQQFTVSQSNKMRHPLERVAQANFRPSLPPPHPLPPPPPPPQMLTHNYCSFPRPVQFHPSHHTTEWYRY